ncbi:hypothetical protein [Sphingosinicella terrae]|uniref:hypothetical protein n=1 Tax=Sphingosinicella terrae TaxID=2172047 RepID=UPI000E0DE8A5|nr:hypothetical protein [Sphingosinicella terrae]
MTDWIWHLRGRVPLDGAEPAEAVLDRIAGLFEAERKPVVVRSEREVVFDDPLGRDFPRSNRSRLVGYDRGRVWIEEGSAARVLRYELRSLHMLLFCLFGAGMAFFVGLVSASLVAGLKAAGLLFAWVYGANILFALLRAPGLIRRAVREAEGKA